MKEGEEDASFPVVIFGSKSLPRIFQGTLLSKREKSRHESTRKHLSHYEDFEFFMKTYHLH